MEGEIFESGKKKLPFQKYPDKCGRDLSDQLQSQARTNVDMSTCSREAELFYPYRSVLI